MSNEPNGIVKLLCAQKAFMHFLEVEVRWGGNTYPPPLPTIGDVVIT